MWRIFTWILMWCQRERFKRLLAGPYRITVIRHDLSRDVVAEGLTLDEALAIENELITDESVLNFVREDEHLDAPARP